MTDLFAYAAPEEEKATPASNNVLTVTELSNSLRRLVEGNFGRVAVEGEISGLKIAASGHAYFSLKDEENTLSAVMWRGSVQKITGFRLEDGLHVVASGKLTTYGARRSYQASAVTTRC